MIKLVLNLFLALSLSELAFASVELLGVTEDLQDPCIVSLRPSEESPSEFILSYESPQFHFEIQNTLENFKKGFLSHPYTREGSQYSDKKTIFSPTSHRFAVRIRDQQVEIQRHSTFYVVLSFSHQKQREVCLLDQELSE